MAKKTTEKEIDFNKVRAMVREKVTEKFGGVSAFLNSDAGKKFGGMKIKIYMYETGPVNFKVISKLCQYLGIGELTRKLVVSRAYFYRLNTCTPSDEKRPKNA